MLRRLLFFIVFTFLVFSAFSQFSKGTRMVGATVASGFFSSGNATHRVTDIGSTKAALTGYSFTLSPSLGWFLSENTVVGATFNLKPSGDKVSFENSGTTFQMDKITNFNISIGGFARNYFKSSSTLLPFAQFGLDFGITSQNAEGFYYGGSGPGVYKETYNSSSSSGFSTNATLMVGATKMLSTQTGLDFFIGYNYSYNKITMENSRTRDEGNDGSIDETGTSETVSKLTNHRFVVGVGFQFFLTKRKK